MLVALAGPLLAVALAAPVPAAPPVFSGPVTPLARLAAAWFRAYGSDERAMRAFYAAHLTRGARAERPLAARLATWQAMRADLGALEPVRVTDERPGSMVVLARAEHGGEVSVLFEAEAERPFGLLGVRVDRGGPPGPPGPPLDDAALVRLADSLLTAATSAGRFSGAALIARGDSVLYRRAFGLADRARGVPNRPETRFNVGSLDKLFTRTAIAQLAAAGKLSLDDSLGKWWPDYPNREARRATLDQIAAHRAGIGDIFGPRYQACDRAALRDNRDFVQLFADQPLLFRPGTSERYSNGGYVVLGEIVSRASGEDYYDYVRRHVAAPAGMKDTDSYFLADTADRATGYTGARPDSLRANTPELPGRGSAAGGGYSTVDDLLRFTRALESGALVDRGWAAWVTGGPRPRRGDPPPEGGGWAFAGGTGGVNAHLVHDGALTLVVLANRDPAVVAPVARTLAAALRRDR